MAQSVTEEAISALASGTYGGIFIDETGSPGLSTTPRHLSSDRKSWVATIVERSQIKEVMDQFPKALSELTTQLGVSEFHFQELYQGKNLPKAASFNRRLAVFRFFGFLFSVYKFPIFVQTFEPDNPAVKYFSEQFGSKKFGPLSFQDYGDSALIVLLLRLRKYLNDIEGGKVRIFLDEGRFKKDSVVQIPGISTRVFDNTITSCQSNILHPLQLADFAAFSINRSQLIVGKAAMLSERDEAFLDAITPAVECFKNMEMQNIARPERS